MNSRWSGKRVAVVGAGRSGAGATELLLQVGAAVTLTDRRAAADLPIDVAPLAGAGAILALGGHPENLWNDLDAVIASPGIAPDAPPLTAARAAGLDVIPEIELAAEFADAPCVAITGSNGKSTVTAMVGAVLQRAGLTAPVCGNIGVPWSSVVASALRGEISPDRYVLELSSFQTEGIEAFRPHWGAILNVSADHLDRYADFDDYAAAKLRLAVNSTASDWLVYGADDPYLVSHPVAGPRPVPFTAAPIDASPAAWLDDNAVYWRDLHDEVHRVLGLDELQVIGGHNGLNAAAAVALGCLAGAAPVAAAAALREFAGLEHRTELCGIVAGVRCVNDSKATNVGATIAALRGIDDPIWLILGGRDKGADFDTLGPYLRSKVRGVLLIGEASETIATTLPADTRQEACDTLETAVERGLAAAQPGEVLLLAPACTSFDQYSDFEARGRHFRSLIAARATIN
jgi:UDP-N-acetylmuramoylalanine--D-glutamate ligase